MRGTVDVERGGSEATGRLKKGKMDRTECKAEEGKERKVDRADGGGEDEDDFDSVSIDSLDEEGRRRACTRFDQRVSRGANERPTYVESLDDSRTSLFLDLIEFFLESLYTSLQFHARVVD